MLKQKDRPIIGDGSTIIKHLQNTSSVNTDKLINLNWNVEFLPFYSVQ